MSSATNPSFEQMTEVELRQWVEAYPARVNDIRSKERYTVLQAAVTNLKSLSLVLWLVAEKGADPNICPMDGSVAVFGF